MCSDSPSHTAAVTAAVFLLLLLGVAAIMYSRCHLNMKLWYKNLYGDYEFNGEFCRNNMNVMFSCKGASFYTHCICVSVLL